MQLAYWQYLRLDFQSYDYAQHIMLIVNLEEQLQAARFEHALHYLVENHIDLKAPYNGYHNDCDC